MTNKNELKENELKKVIGGTENGMCKHGKLALTNCETCAQCEHLVKNELNDYKTHYHCYCSILNKDGFIHINKFN